MVVRVKKSSPAFKHGAYSAVTILPGESAAEFEKLHEELIAELAPSGALEHNIVATIAQLVWRRQNLRILRLATFARGRYSQIRQEEILRRTTNPPFAGLER